MSIVRKTESRKLYVEGPDEAKILRTNDESHENGRIARDIRIRCVLDYRMTTMRRKNEGFFL